MEEKIGITILMVVLGIVCYRFGYKMCENDWRDRLEERVTELINEKLNEVRALYDETYRNVLRDLLAIKKEVEEENSTEKI